jgi:hypothetical protein
MKGRTIVLDHVNGLEAAAFLVDGQLDDLLVDDTDAPRPGAIYRAICDRPIKGQGGMMLRLGNGDQAVTPSYMLHLGLAVGDAEFALRANLAPEALTLPVGSTGEQEVGIYATRATFNYRFLQGTPVHPVAGLGLEMIAASPAHGDDGYAFAATARLGLELAFPLSDGALALGLDTTGHLPFTRTKTFPIDLSFMLGFGAYVDYRF